MPKSPDQHSNLGSENSHENAVKRLTVLLDELEKLPGQTEVVRDARQYAEYLMREAATKDDSEYKYEHLEELVVEVNKELAELPGSVQIHFTRSA